MFLIGTMKELVALDFRVEELERSLSIMKEQQSFLKEQLRIETERKKELKQELEKDHQRIVALERQLRDKRRAGRRKSQEDQEGESSNITIPFFAEHHLKNPRCASLFVVVPQVEHQTNRNWSTNGAG